MDKDQEKPMTEERGTLVTQVSHEATGNASADRENAGSLRRPSEPNAINVLPTGTSADQTHENRPNSIASPPVKAPECAPVKSEDGPSFIVKGFASREELARWFPQIEDDESKSWRIWISKRSRALLVHTGIVGAILLVNFSFTLWGVTRYAYPHGVATIYQGSCAFVKRLDLWLHLLINVLSTGMLMASNYCMQLQAAPTRKNVDVAHKAGDWLDIGVPSLRNLRYIGKWRRFSWLLLALSSLPVHLIYNSAVFTSLASNDYTVAVVKEAFLSGGNWNLTAAEQRGLGDPGLSWVVNNLPGYGWRIPVMTAEETIRAMQVNGTRSYTRTNVSQCFEIYDNYWATLGNVIIVANNESIQGQKDDTLLLYASIVPNSNDWAKDQWARANGTKVSTRARTQAPKVLPINTWYLGPGYYNASYCLVQPPATTAERCRLEYAPGIMVVICIINTVKTIVMFSVWYLRLWDAHKRPMAHRDNEDAVLYTLGDAIASFMRDPDMTTVAMCLATRHDFRRKRDARLRSHLVAKPIVEPREWIKPQSLFWRSAASLHRWIVLLSLCVLVLAIASGLLALSLVSLSTRNISRRVPSLWNLGFGALTPFTFISIGLPRDDPAGLISNVLVANLPQFVLSFLYIFYNGMMSSFLVQREFSRMRSVRKPLRVSEPLGIQRGSYFISLPLRYGIPLYVTSAAMHWLVSQSLFLARITAFYPNGDVDISSSFSTCGYSPIALFITILVGICLVLGLVGIGYRKYDTEMPLVASNSRAISAACHVLPEDIGSGYMLPVQWGVIKVDKGVGHCAFTTAWDVLTEGEDISRAKAIRFA